MRHQLPAWSPLTLGAIGAGVLPGASATETLTARIRSEYGAHLTVLTDSGTTALALSFLASAPSRARPRIALPAWACYDLMTAADVVDAEVVLYDLVPETLAPDRESLHFALAAEPHAVVVAHWFGLPVDLGSIEPLVRAAGAVVIDDAAQAVGASIGGKPLGAGGAYGVLSFGRGKGRTGGSGGAILAPTEAAAESLRRAQSRLAAAVGGVGALAALAAQWALGRPWLYGIPSHLPGLRLGETIYRRSEGMRRMSPRAAAIVNAVWALASRESEVRRTNAERWRAVLADQAGIHSYRSPENSIAGWLRYPILLDPQLGSALAGSQARRHGVMPGYPGVLADLPVAPERFMGAPRELSGGRTLAARLFTLPTHRHLRDLDFATIRRCVQTER